MDQEKYLYFVDQKYLFKFDKITENKEFIDGFDVKEIVEYNGYLVGLQYHGDIWLLCQVDKDRYIWPPDQTDKNDPKQWIQIGNNTLTIESHGLNLVALTNEGEVWSHQIGFKDVRITTLKKQRFLLNGYERGKHVAFDKTRFTDVQALYNNGDYIIIEFKTGSQTIF